MKNWKEREATFEVHEISKKSHEVYLMTRTGAEISSWCKAKNELYGYMEGLGGDKSYGCWAVELLA
jgi:hypothetical protein